MHLKRMLKGSLLFLLFLISTLVEEAEGLSSLNLLKNVVTHQEEDAVIFRLEFEKPVGSYGAPVFFKKSIQVDFDNTFIKPAKRYFPTGDILISEVYVAQFDPETVRVRFVLDGKLENINSNFHLDKQGRFLIARIDKVKTDVLEDLLKKIRERDRKRPEEPVLKAQDVKSVENFSLSKEILSENNPRPVLAVLNKTRKEDFLPSKKLVITDDKKTIKFLNFQESSKDGSLNLVSSGITMFSMLTVVLALMFFVFYLFKKFVLKNGLLGGDGNLIKILGTGMIAPRKTIALVEVAGEILVLGISNDHIALLSTIQDEDKIKQIKEESFSRSKLSSSFRFENRGDSKSLQETGQSANEFRKYLKRFTADSKPITADSKPTKEQSIAEIKAMIRKNLVKVQTA